MFWIPIKDIVTCTPKLSNKYSSFFLLRISSFEYEPANFISDFIVPVASALIENSDE